MPQFKSNLVITNYEHRTANGIEYLVVPSVPVRAQVMNNYLVPAEELEFADIWNGTPLTIRHPKQNNGSAQVPEPDVAVIGKFFNAEWDEEGQRVTGEYWINISEAMKYVEGQYILGQIYSNRVLETSTGYWAATEDSSGEFEGREYNIVQHNLHPNHIAILVDEIGACSVDDGCGVNRNSLLNKIYANHVIINGGPGSGDFGHTGREGQVGGSGPAAKSKKQAEKKSKVLKKSQNAYSITTQREADRLKKTGIRTRTSLLSGAKAQALWEKMQEREGMVVVKVRLAKGTPYESISATSIVVKGIPASAISITDSISTTEPFTNAIDCGCDNPTQFQLMVVNQESLMQKVDNIRKAFYDHYSESDLLYSAYIRDFFPDYLILESKGKLWKCTYSESSGEYTFQEPDDWTKVEQQYVEANAMQVNVTGNLPPAATKIYEAVYKKWLAGHPKDKAGASKMAWGAVKKAGWKKVGDKWVKQNVSGGYAKGVYAIGNKPNPLVRVIQTNHKEKTMKVSLKGILDALRGKGVTLNEDEIEGMEDEIDIEAAEEDEQEEEAAEELTPAVTKHSRTPVLNAKQLKTLQSLESVDFNQLIALSKAAPALVELTQNAQTELVAKKSSIIGRIVANRSNQFTKEELEGMSLSVLTKMEAGMNVDYSAIMGGNMFVNEGSDDEDVLALPVSIGGE